MGEVNSGHGAQRSVSGMSARFVPSRRGGRRVLLPFRECCRRDLGPFPRRCRGVLDRSGDVGVLFAG